MDRPVARRALAALIYANAFVVGNVLMGFEMLGSRYLFPYFGGGIGTWAGLISMVLAALTIGYFAGGAIVDRHPSPMVVAVSVALAACYLACVPSTADQVLSWIMNTIGEGPAGILLAASALLLIPVSLLGTISPVAVRLLLRSTEEGGRVSAMIYGISTVGNVVGTLGTTFILIPSMGSRAITYLYAALLAACALSMFLVSRPRSAVPLLALSLALTGMPHAASAAPDPATLDHAWSGERAMKDIAAQMPFAPRSPDMPGHARTIAFIRAALAKIPGLEFGMQEWQYRAADGRMHGMTNIIARFDPLNPRRILLGTHYDSLVRAYRDAENPDAPMPGANNSASGVALLLETARALAGLPPPKVGVDFVFFDGEEGPKALGEGDRQWVALGSPYFAAHLNYWYPQQKPASAVIFDMVCYKNLALSPERSSLKYAAPQVEQFWNIGRAVAPSVFHAEPTPHFIGDDQMALQALGIPSFLVIGFAYDPWYNTTQDTLDKCSSASLEAVGHTLLRYIYAQ